MIAQPGLVDLVVVATLGTPVAVQREVQIAARHQHAAICRHFSDAAGRYSRYRSPCSSASGKKFVTGAPVVTAIVLPAAAVAGAATIFGRVRALPSAFSRYGSVKISPSRWLVVQSPHSPPPPMKPGHQGATGRRCDT